MLIARGRQGVPESPDSVMSFSQAFFFFFLINPLQLLKLIYLCTFGCAGSSLPRGLSLVAESEGYSLVAVRRRLIAVASLVAEHSSGVHAGFSSWGSRALEHGLRSCGAQTRLLPGMWDLPWPGTEAVSPESAGAFFITEPPGKSLAKL